MVLESTLVFRKVYIPILWPGVMKFFTSVSKIDVMGHPSGVWSIFVPCKGSEPVFRVDILCEFPLSYQELISHSTVCLCHKKIKDGIILHAECMGKKKNSRNTQYIHKNIHWIWPWFPALFFNRRGIYRKQHISPCTWNSNIWVENIVSCIWLQFSLQK